MRNPALAAALASLLGGCCFGGGEQSHDAAFVQGCVSSCIAERGGSTCQPYCECTAAQIQARGQGARVRELQQQGRPEALLDELWFADVVGICGADYLDESFRVGCMDGCAGQATCAPSCQCFLDHIRDGMSGEDGTRWMFVSFEHEPYPPDVQARMDSAVAACMSAAQ